ncbi:hypothetical protein [Streptomyces triticirhizae]|uniref:hypothetical protein n=1 Tax=Streptomyces triticirhizae TaxID=2483353 RepID=UPI0011C360D9|nr:hypothetical protein [Streptomyces triticirhizae]
MTDGVLLRELIEAADQIIRETRRGRLPTTATERLYLLRRAGLLAAAGAADAEADLALATFDVRHNTRRGTAWPDWGDPASLAEYRVREVEAFAAGVPSPNQVHY